jgi:hypothetical protein
MPEIIDLDVFAPPARSVQFTDRAGKRHVFDVTFVSFKTSMFMIAHLDEFRGIMHVEPKDVDEGTYRTILGVIEEIGSKADPEITVDFLFENLSIAQGLKLLEVAMKPIADFVASNPPGAEDTER